MGIQAEWPQRPRVARGVLTWRSELCPSPASPVYTVSLTYRVGEPPKVFVDAPRLDPGHRERLPHVYDGDRLCLYTPGEWQATMSIAKTIIPWTAEWLLHYELWKATDRWAGGGHTYAPLE